MRRMFSENQILALVKENPSAVLEALENQDLKVKTLEQSEYEYSKDFTLTPSSTHFEADSAFTKILVKNRSMYICIVDKLTNNDTEAHTTSFNQIDISDIPEEYQKKIYDVNSKSLDEAPIGATGNIIARFPLYIATSSLYVTLSHPSAGVLRISASGNSASIAAGTSVIVDGRIELLL